MKLLLHTCCAPCSVYCVESLRKENIEPTLFWYNPNIHPYTEYVNRRDTLVRYTESIDARVIIEDEYGLDDFCVNTSGNIEKRCTSYCYPLRLKKTFEYAKENGFDAVSTTLLYSIYQNHDFIKSFCEKLSRDYGIEFVYRDFRVGFWYGHDKAVENGLYMQKYCGCIFSEEERYLNSSQSKPSLPEGFEFLNTSRINVNREQKENGDIYSLTKDGLTVCKTEITLVGGAVFFNDFEIDKEYKNMGYEQRLLKSFVGNYKNRFSKIIVRAKPENIPFYIKNGFDIFEGMEKDSFENDLILLSKEI